MSSDREATSDQSSSVCEGASYDEVYSLGHRPEEGLSWSLEREPSAHSPDDREDYDVEGVEEEDKYDKGKGENEEEYKGEGDGGEDKGDGRTPEGGSLRSSRDGHNRPFILPMIWTVNDFKQTMTTNIVKNLRDCYQILDNIPILLP